MRFTQNSRAARAMSTHGSPRFAGLGSSAQAPSVNILVVRRDAFAKQARRSAQGCCRERSCNRTRPACAFARTLVYVGVSTMRTAPSSSRSPRGRRASSRFLGDFTPQYWVSDRYAGQLGWAEKEIRSASPISFATCNTRSTAATASSARTCGICSARPARSRRGARIVGRHAKELRLSAGGAPRQDHGANADAFRRRQAQGDDQADPPASVRVHDVRELPATNNGSERAIRARRHLSQGDILLSQRLGRPTLRDIRSVIETGRRAPSTPSKQSV